ncbi:MAG TPA: hypothetical protein VNY83_07910 [Solirubrobacterales bacterium]|nr:hypothetical protein [Solirubrobacterales bacterium]
MGGASAAVVEVGNLVLRADGGFEPLTLPRKAFAPIDFQGHADIAAKDGSVPAVLQEVVLDFDRDGRLNTRGLPTCPVGRVENATPQEARMACRGAIVGTGHVAASIALPGQALLHADSPLTVFNGVPQHGDPTVILHARTTTPGVQTFSIVVPIERRLGPYGYRATIDIPPIAAGFGALTHIDAKIGRRYSFDGRKRSYTSARCSNGILQTRGRFTFADGTIIDGSVMKPCSVR